MNKPSFSSASEFFQRAAAAVEKSPLHDVRRNVRALAQSAAGRLDLVGRDEFDALQALLADANARIADLEKRVAALEGPAGGEPAAAQD